MKSIKKIYNTEDVIGVITDMFFLKLDSKPNLFIYFSILKYDSKLLII